MTFISYYYVIYGKMEIIQVGLIWVHISFLKGESFIWPLAEGEAKEFGNMIRLGCITIAALKMSGAKCKDRETSRS